ncbi:hypothetical protein [Methylobacterium sp. Leaf112]|uniref:hypothetical protein n=1 Tax=Methylobacterium sp. Leaf112 TaxID=1736258 RepID=UPI0007016594|nr:hypothetical protein [Methylobacterium sp. Leaf112]KQP67902.1 hypothetical protein ASF52_18650 [Methylobacterium sp. Leaf112]
MQQLPRIKAAYDWFYGQWQREASRLAEAGDVSALAKLDEKRDTLERGVFVLMFGQFEVAVDSIFQTARTRRLGEADWALRRGWDTGSLQGRKIPFETKLSLVLDRRSPTFGKILGTYATRNHCAHGGMELSVGSIDSLAAELYAWCSELRP